MFVRLNFSRKYNFQIILLSLCLIHSIYSVFNVVINQLMDEKEEVTKTECLETFNICEHTF